MLFWTSNHPNVRYFWNHPHMYLKCFINPIPCTMFPLHVPPLLYQSLSLSSSTQYVITHVQEEDIVILGQNNASVTLFGWKTHSLLTLAKKLATVVSDGWSTQVIYWQPLSCVLTLFRLELVLSCTGSGWNHIVTSCGSVAMLLLLYAQVCVCVFVSEWVSVSVCVRVCVCVCVCVCETSYMQQYTWCFKGNMSWYRIKNWLSATMNNRTLVLRNQIRWHSVCYRKL